jgi:hypothetical protein
MTMPGRSPGDSMHVTGIVQQGHQVASGRAETSPFPAGTIELQAPIFAELGLDLSWAFMGTVNVSIEPFCFRILEPDYTFTDVKWTESYPPETFSFARCTLTSAGRAHSAWIYYPHPETKISHFQPPSLIEIITQPIEAISYGSQVDIAYDPRSVEVFPQ